MEEALAPSAEQVRNIGDSYNTNDFDRPPKHISVKKTLIRKKSVFKLAAEFFKPKKDELPTLEHEKQGKTRLPWNTFASLQGFRESKKRPSIFGAARCRSSSPQKRDDTDEFCMPKTMRRKSLQDLLGTVGTKFSLVRRHAYSDDSVPQIEAPLEAMTEFQDISTLVLPEPALPLPEPSAPVLNSPCHYSTDSTSNGDRSPRNNPKSHRDGEEDPAGRPKLQTKPSFRIIHAATQPTNPTDRQSPSKTHRKSQELEHIPSSLSSGMLCPTAPAHHLRGISAQVPVGVRFVDEKDAPQYRYGDDFEDITAPENENLDPAFLGRAINREARYNSILGGLNSEQTEPVAENTEKQENFNAANISMNLYLSTNQSRWSADSSETGTDNTSDYDWVEKEVEVQDIIDRGKEIMTLGTLSPYLHSSSMGNFLTPISIANPVEDNKIQVIAPEGIRLDEDPSQLRSVAFSPHHNSHVYVQECLNPKEDLMSSASYDMRPMLSDKQELEFSRSGNLTMTDDKLQRGCKPKQGTRQVISLQNGERFRPRIFDSHMIPDEPVHIVYPPSEICAGHTKIYLSKNSALEDLYHNHSGFSDFCLFDRCTRTYYPQAFSDPIPDFIQTNAEMLEVLWLPLEIFPADVLTGKFDREYDWLSPVGGLISVADGQLCYKAVGLPNPDSSSLQKSDVNNSERSFSTIENTASISSLHDSAYSEQGSGEGYSESTPHIDVVGMSSSNYTVTLISTREVSGLTTRSVISNDPQIELDDMDDSYDIAVDPASARRYLGSSFSSTESLQSIVEAGVTHSKSIDSTSCKLKDAQPEEAKHVKTWVEMEREFLDKFAPGSQMYPDRGRGIAVYEAFKKLQGLANVSDDDRLTSSGSATLTENEKWLRYKESYMEFSFETSDDIAATGSINVERSATANSSYAQESSNQSPGADVNIIFNAGDKGEENVKVTNRAHKSPVQIASFRNHLRDMLVEDQAADSELSIAEGMSNKINLGTGRTGGGRESNIVPLGNQSRVGSEVYSDTESTGITMLSGYMFTHYAEQLGECSHDEEERRSDQRTCAAFFDHTTHVAPKIRDNTMPIPTEGLKIDTGLESDTDQLNICPKNENIGIVKVMTAQLCPLPIRVCLSPQLPECSIFLDASHLKYPETSNSPNTSGSHLLTRKRTISPKMRVPSPLTNFSFQKSQIFQCASPSPSEADTEVSENFGQKLMRYKQIEEEDKENDLWWKDSISYG